MIRLGVIGYGGRIAGVCDLIDKLGAGTEIVAVADPDRTVVQDRLKARGIDLDRVAIYDDADAMLDREKLDGVLIGTRCSLHTLMAKKVFKHDLPLYLEKPVATNMQDLMSLRDAGAKTKSEVVVSFPLRVTPLVQLAKEIVDSGRIGTVEHVQAWNNVPYGWCYYLGWYRDEDETQGLWLQKATHDFDYINYLLGLRPTTICAMKSKRIYKGDRPAGLRCDDCRDMDNCMESPYQLYYSRHETDRVKPSGRMCGFAVDTGNEDSGSAIVRYETGMHVSYSQNFFARGSAGARGARLFGYKGTVEFDWYRDEVNVFMHHTPRVESYKLDSSSASHGGGDTVLADNFVRVIREDAKSVSPLSAGLLSVLMCLKAKESSETCTFQDICYDDESQAGTL